MGAWRRYPSNSGPPAASRVYELTDWGMELEPVIVGLGIGGTFDSVARLAKHGLLREVGSTNPDPESAAFEEEILSEINKLGIGPHGFGGRITALGVHIETLPCHIASLPVAVNLQCGPAARHRSIVL
jgi:fumarate hydratase subunit alpha